ncbi:MAG: hypothetical protein L6Q37_11945, partial [Bdellovibrionaceae bacterium]|nr:hypothetical protein [Pseudobdellovibrionaceae bacterium]
FNWTETFTFEFLAEPTFLKFERNIISKGLHSGSESITYAINLWDTENYKNIVDLSKNKVSPLVEGNKVEQKLAARNETSAFDLWLEDGRVFITDEKMGEELQLKYDFSLQPFIKFKKTSGEPFNYALKSGLFKGKIQLLQRYFDGNSKENQYDIFGEDSFDAAKMEKGILSFSKTLKFKSPPTRGNLFLRIQIESQLPINNLKSFTGLFPLGDYRNFKTNQFLKVTSSPELLQEVAKKIPGNSRYDVNKNTQPSSENENETRSDSLISIAPLSIDPLSGEQINYHKKMVKYIVTACFSNNLVTSPLVFQKFKVYGFSQNENQPGELKDVKKTNHLGCVYWTDNVEFDMYDCHHFYRGYVIVENQHFNFKEKIYYFVNPWEPYLLGTDEKKIDNVNVLSTSCDSKKPKKSEILIDSVVFENQGQQNENKINHKLDIEITRHLSLTFHPKVSVPSDIRDDYNAKLESLANGIYLLRLAFFKNLKTSNKKELIFYKEIPVLNKNNIVTTDLDFTLKDKRLLETKNSMIIQLLPVKQEDFEVVSDYKVIPKSKSKSIQLSLDNNTSLLSPIFKQEFSLDGDGKQVSLRTFKGSEITTHFNVTFNEENKNFDLNSFIQAFRSEEDLHQQRLLIPPKANDFALKNQLLLYENKKIEELKFKNAAIKTIEASKNSFDEQSVEKLCDYWFENNWKEKFRTTESLFHRYCKSEGSKNLKSIFDLNYVYLIHNVSGSKYLGPGLDKNLTTSDSYSLSTSINNFSSSALSTGVKVGVKPPPTVIPEWFSLGAEVGAQISSGQQSATSESNSITLNEMSNLQVSESHFQITTSKYQKCLSIKPNASLFYDSGKNSFLKVWDAMWKTDMKTEMGNLLFKSDITESEKMEASNKGILICKSDLATTPFSFQESYYWVQPNLSTNELQDAKDERTKINSFMLRGVQDFTRFKYFLTTKWTLPEGSKQIKLDSERIFNNLIYLKYFQATLPGIYIQKEK